MKLKLIKKQDEASGTKSFFWEPEKPVTYLPGQYFYYTIPTLKYPDPRGTTRHFTLSSSPTEGNILRLTTRVREGSGFKKTMDELPIGSTVDGEGPNGIFTFDEKITGQQIFIAGGIGITPYRGMLKYVADKNLKTPILLIYSNSVPEEITFRKELEEISAAHPNVILAMTVSHPEDSKEPWTGLTGRVDENLINSLDAKYKFLVTNPTWWLCGPPPMVDAMEQLLGRLKVTIDHVRSEKFTGY